MPESGVLPQVLCYSGFYELGIDEVLKMIFEYINKVKENGYFQYRRNEQSKYWMYETINERLKNSFYHNKEIHQLIQPTENEVLGGQVSSFIAANRLLDKYFDLLKKGYSAQ
jgi:LAO/AO transport system kinase